MSPQLGTVGVLADQLPGILSIHHLSPILGLGMILITIWILTTVHEQYMMRLRHRLG
jgi:hypothetical protein